MDTQLQPELCTCAIQLPLGTGGKLRVGSDLRLLDPRGLQDVSGGIPSDPVGIPVGSQGGQMIYLGCFDGSQQGESKVNKLTSSACRQVLMLGNHIAAPTHVLKEFVELIKVSSISVNFLASLI